MSDVERITELVRTRAGNRCEYCRMHQSLQGATFHVEHVQPRSKGGSSTSENLAWCCPSCNLQKSARVDAVDADRNELVPHFNPRRDNWNDHFAWDDRRLVARTASGRATLHLLRLNDARRLMIRSAEERFNLFQPTCSPVSKEKLVKPRFPTPTRLQHRRCHIGRHLPNVSYPP